MIIELKTYRARRRKEWFNRYSTLLDAQVRLFMCRTLDVNFSELCRSYMAGCHENYEQSWNYEELRDLVHEQLDGEVVRKLYDELSARPWFDPRLISEDNLLEYCLNIYCSS